LRPLAVLIAIVFGSTAAISFGLVATLIVLFILKDNHPEFAGELKPLMFNSGLFLLLLAASGASLYANLKSLPWRGLAFGAMCLILIGTGFFLWP
jgi:hypothetical protein